MGYQSCNLAIIQNANNIYCDSGYRGCGDTLITATKNIYVTGYLEIMYNSTIISSNVDGNNMNVYFLTDLESYQSTVTICCSRNDNCTIFCKTYDSCQDRTTSSAVQVYCKGNCQFVCSPDDGILCPQRINSSCPFVPTTAPTTLPSGQPTMPSVPPTTNPTSAPTIRGTPLIEWWFDNTSAAISSSLSAQGYDGVFDIKLYHNGVLKTDPFDNSDGGMYLDGYGHMICVNTDSGNVSYALTSV